MRQASLPALLTSRVSLAGAAFMRQSRGKDGHPSTLPSRSFSPGKTILFHPSTLPLSHPSCRLSEKPDFLSYNHYRECRLSSVWHCDGDRCPVHLKGRQISRNIQVRPQRAVGRPVPCTKSRGLRHTTCIPHMPTSLAQKSCINLGSWKRR